MRTVYHRVDGSHDGEAVGARPGQHRGLAAQGYQSERGGIGGGVSLRLTRKARIDDLDERQQIGDIMKRLISPLVLFLAMNTVGTAAEAAKPAEKPALKEFQAGMVKHFVMAGFICYIVL